MQSIEAGRDTYRSFWFSNHKSDQTQELLQYLTQKKKQCCVTVVYQFNLQAEHLTPFYGTALNPWQRPWPIGSCSLYAASALTSFEEKLIYGIIFHALANNLA